MLLCVNLIILKLKLACLFFFTQYQMNLKEGAFYMSVEFKLCDIVNCTPSGCITFLGSNLQKYCVCSNQFFADTIADASIRIDKALHVHTIHAQFESFSLLGPKHALSNKGLPCGEWFIIGISWIGTWWDGGQKLLPAIASTTHTQKPTYHHQNMTWCHIPKFTLY